MKPSVESALIGRDAELALLRQKMAAAAAGRGSMVLLAGEDGSGKSRLGAEVGRIAHRCGMPYLAGGGDPAGPEIAYGCLVEILKGLDREAPDSGRRALRDAVEQFAPHLRQVLFPGEGEVTPAEDDGDVEMRRALFLIRVKSLLLAAAEERPLVLFIDDLHLADWPALLLLRQIAQQIHQMPMIVIGAYRTDGHADDPSRWQRLNRLVLHLCSESRAELLNLGPLSLRETRALADSCFAPADFTQDLVGQLYQKTAGSPLFVVQCLEFLRDRGIIYRQRGIWRNRRVEDLPVAHSVRELARQRVQALPGAYQSLLSRAAVQGQRFEGVLLASVLRRPTVEVLRTLGRIERHTHVIESADRQFLFAHGVLAQTLYEQLPLAERRRLHRRVADVLEARVPRETESLAFHLYRSDSAIRALPYLITSGERAYAASDYLATRRLYEAALETCEFIEAEQARIRKLDVLLVLAQVDERIGEWAQSARRCREVLRISHPEHHALMIGKALMQLASLRLRRGDPEEALQLNREALETLEPLGEPSVLAEVYVRIGLSTLSLSRREEARRYFAQARQLAGSGGDGRLRALIRQQFGVLSGLEGRHLEATLCHMRALRSRRRSGDGYGICESCAGLGADQEDQGRWQEALRCYAESAGLARQLGAADLVALSQVHEARAHLRLGDYGAADAACRAARNSMEAMGYARGMTQCDLVEGMIHRNQQQYPRAAELLGQARFRLQGQGDQLTLAECTREIGLLRQGQGDLETARTDLRESLTMFRDVGSVEQARITERMLLDLPSSTSA